MANEVYYRILKKMGGLQVVRMTEADEEDYNVERWLMNVFGNPMRFDTREAAHDAVARNLNHQIRQGRPTQWL